MIFRSQYPSFTNVSTLFLCRIYKIMKNTKALVIFYSIIINKNVIIIVKLGATVEYSPHTGLDSSGNSITQSCPGFTFNSVLTDICVIRLNNNANTKLGTWHSLCVIRNFTLTEFVLPL